MTDKRKVLQRLLMAGAVYFMAISVVHVMGVKVAGLYIYYNIPSLQYQDDIISFLSFGWAVFFYTAMRHPHISPGVVIAAMIALLGVAKINLTTEFATLSPVAELSYFWVQFSLLGVYVMALAVASVQYGRQGKHMH